MGRFVINIYKEGEKDFIGPFYAKRTWTGKFALFRIGGSTNEKFVLKTIVKEDGTVIEYKGSKYSEEFITQLNRLERDDKVLMEKRKSSPTDKFQDGNYIALLLAKEQ